MMVGHQHAAMAMLCPVCGVVWEYQRGGEHVTCIRDRHIVDAHPDHAFALVVVARREIERAHPLDEPCPDEPAVMDVTVDTRAVPPDLDLGPFDFSPVVEKPNLTLVEGALFWFAIRVWNRAVGPGGDV